MIRSILTSVKASSLRRSGKEGGAMIKRSRRIEYASRVKERSETVIDVGRKLQQTALVII